jgi:hypothetical protein
MTLPYRHARAFIYLQNELFKVFGIRNDDLFFRHFLLIPVNCLFMFVSVFKLYCIAVFEGGDQRQNANHSKLATLISAVGKL